MKRYMKYVFGYLAIYYVNNTRDTVLNEKMNMQNLEYLHICPPYTYDDEFSVSV